MEPGVEVVKAAKGSVSLMVQSVVNAFLGLFFFIVFARHVSKVEMGVYAAVLSTYGLFQVLGSFGLLTAATRFTSKMLAEELGEKASSAARKIVGLASAFSIVASIIYFFLAPFFSLQLCKSFDYVYLFKLVSLIIPVTVLSIILDGLMQGIQEFEALALIRIIGQGARVFATIILLFMGYGILAALIGWMISSIFLSILPLPFLRKLLRFKANSYPLKPIVNFSIPLLGANLLSYASSYTDLFIAMVYLKPFEVGAYEVSITAYSPLVTVALAPFQATLLPAMSKAFGKGGLSLVERSFLKAVRYIALIYVPAAIGFASASRLAIFVMAGGSYRESMFPFTLIAVSSLAFGLANPILIALQSIGETASIFKVMVVALLFEAITGLCLTSIFRIIGAAVSRAVLFLAIMIYSVYEAKKFIRLSFDFKPILKAFFASGIMGLIVFWLQNLWSSTFMAPIHAFIGLTVYILTLKALREISEYDLAVAMKILPKKIHCILTPLLKILTI